MLIYRLTISTLNQHENVESRTHGKGPEMFAAAVSFEIGFEGSVRFESVDRSKKRREGFPNRGVSILKTTMVETARGMLAHEVWRGD